MSTSKSNTQHNIDSQQDQLAVVYIHQRRHSHSQIGSSVTELYYDELIFIAFIGKLMFSILIHILFHDMQLFLPGTSSHLICQIIQTVLILDLYYLRSVQLLCPLSRRGKGEKGGASWVPV